MVISGVYAIKTNTYTKYSENLRQKLNQFLQGLGVSVINQHQIIKGTSYL